jgi:hypothetical protein
MAKEKVQKENQRSTKKDWETPNPLRGKVGSHEWVRKMADVTLRIQYN